jgi:hypothetical protein
MPSTVRSITIQNLVGRLLSKQQFQAAGSALPGKASTMSSTHPPSQSWLRAWLTDLTGPIFKKAADSAHRSMRPLAPDLVPMRLAIEKQC